MVAVAVLTYLHIVIGEMVPKALALQRAGQDGSLRFAASSEHCSTSCCRSGRTLNAVGNRLLRLAGIERREVERERYHTAEELEFIVRESQEGGMLRGEAGQILRDLFEFGDRTAGEVMVPRVLLAGIPVGAEPDELQSDRPRARRTRDIPFTAATWTTSSAACTSRRSSGISSRTNRSRPETPEPCRTSLARRRSTKCSPRCAGFARRWRSSWISTAVQPASSPSKTCSRRSSARSTKGRARRAIVREADGRVRVRGTVRLDEAGEALGRSIEHEKVTTISGLVLLLLNRPASVGDVVTWRNVRIEVVSIAGRGVGEALLSVTKPPVS